MSVVEPISPARNRSTEARRAARQARAKRERRILDLLNRGFSVVEIAGREGVTEKRMRALVRAILARRMPEPPAEYVALQVSRLNEALLVAYSAMSGANLGAVDRVVKIVRELDRYHGLTAAGQGVVVSRLEAQDRLAHAAPQADRLEMAPQAIEKAQSAPGDGLTPEASLPQEPSPVRDEASACFLETPMEASPELDAPQADRPETAPQALEKAQSAPGNGVGPEAFAPQEPAPVPDDEAFGRFLETSTSSHAKNLKQPQPGQLAAQSLRHVGEAGLRLVDIGRGGFRLIVAPALERAHRPRRDRDNLSVEPQFATADAVSVDEWLDRDNSLPRRDLALDDPVERAAVDNVRRALRRHAGNVGMAQKGAAALGLEHARRHPLPEVIERVRTDAELDKMEGHGGILSRWQPTAPAPPAPSAPPRPSPSSCRRRRRAAGI